jgi:uncharacterized membrane protein (Fun14 family)
MVENKDPVSSAIDKLKPVLAKLGFGSIMGYCSGYATKKVGKMAAFAVGVGFIFFQGLVSTGYITIDWNKVKDDAVKKVDTVSLQCRFLTHFLCIFCSYVLSILFA